eukprot:TRINITY_DN6466_c0_g1_i1.p1 TRINITY_DN6466_c0_g1~~TRINITY_DN6466_c0_g1_i1.p1  ORF type:complete len:182 (+),score=52.97 TRINITY_DN6466_c0_g1_i1:173-718(+)
MAKRVKAVDPWQLLEVKKGVDPKTLRTAFQKSAFKHHPDAPGGCATKFMEVQKAYDAVRQAEEAVLKTERDGIDSSSSRMGGKVRLARGEKPRKRNPRINYLREKHVFNSKGNLELNDQAFEKLERMGLRKQVDEPLMIEVQNRESIRVAIVAGAVFVLFFNYFSSLVPERDPKTLKREAR